MTSTGGGCLESKSLRLGRKTSPQPPPEDQASRGGITVCNSNHSDHYRLAF